MSAAPAALPPIALTLIGIGTGNPDHLTRQAIAAMNAASSGGAFSTAEIPWSQARTSMAISPRKPYFGISAA